MGYQIIGEEGIVTSWGDSGDDCYHFLNTGAAPYQARLSITTETLDATVFASGLKSRAVRSGLGAWEVEITARFPRSTPKGGNEGLITFAAGYVLHLGDYTLNLDWGAVEITEKAATAVVWKAFRPRHLQWSGTYQVLADSGTGLSLPTAATTAPSAATFKVTEEGGTDNAFTGSIRTESLGVGITIGNRVEGDYAFSGSGDLTVVGSSNMLPAGALALPDWDNDSDGVADRSLVITAASGRTYTGNAYLRSLSVSVPTANMIEVRAIAQGSGALTVA
jgi:hypothetical protein